MCRTARSTFSRSGVYLCDDCREKWAEPWPDLNADRNEHPAPEALVAAWKELWRIKGEQLAAAIDDVLRNE